MDTSSLHPLVDSKIIAIPYNKNSLTTGVSLLLRKRGLKQDLTEKSLEKRSDKDRIMLLDNGTWRFCS